LANASQSYPAPQFQAPGGCLKRAEVLNINGDGKSDLVNFGNLNFYTNPIQASVDYTVLRSNGSGFEKFTAEIYFPCDFCTPTLRPSEPNWVRADFDGDGKTDVVAVYRGQWIDGNGVPQPPIQNYLLPLLSSVITFVARPVVTGGRLDGAVGSWVAGDLNGDGRADLAVAEPGYASNGTQYNPQVEVFLSS